MNVVGTERLFQFMTCVKNHDADAGLELINTLLQEGYDIQEFLIGMTEHLRNLYIAHHSPQLYLVEASEETKARYKSSAEDFSRDDLMRMLHIVSEAQIKLKDASQPRIQFEITLLKLIHMERTENLKELLTALDELKKNFSSQGLVEKDQSQVADKTEQNSGKSTSAEQDEVQTNQTSEKEEPVPDEQQKSDSVESKEAEPESLQNEPVEDVVPEPVEDEYDFGRPAIETSISQKARVLHLHNGNGKPEPKKTVAPTDQVKTDSTVPGKKLRIEDLKAIWPQFLQSLTDRIPKILELQVLRVKPVQLKGMELLLECDNPLSKRMLDEQATELAKMLKEHIGVVLRFNTQVVNSPESKSKARNPYERFKEIQQKDPILRDLVERFGAELEY